MTPASSSTLARLSAASLPVWLVDDEADVRDSLSQWLEVSGLEVRTFSRAGKALNALQNSQPCGVVVSDIKMPEMDGLALFAAVQALDTPPPVILITGHGDVPMAVAAIQQGAWDFVQKPFDPERLEECVRRALEHRALALENLQLQQALRHNYLSTRLLGDSALMQVLRRQVENLAASRANVVINGETGSGKEVVARALHDFGSGSQGAFVALNCGAMNSELIESELFGHEKGAFTGAGERRIGLLETASHGTLFLDEIESLPLSAQVKLLRALQEGEITRLGSNQVIHLHLRVVAASKENLLQMVSQGDFREDLYYRLAIAELAIPPLRERREDIPLLFRHFCHQAADVHERPLREPTTELLTALGNHRWPGNLRELRNIATRFILGLDLPWQRSSMPSHQASALSVRMEVFEATVLKEALQRHHGSIQAVLDELDLPRRTLNQKMQRHQLRREDFLAT
ncbi:sigma-54-dependent transcriptional regulator [Vreelandella venusta]|uniref:DNA-binding response regulator n=1 Tax=Vreelandella venusta TaxID=44935 RepID=A0ABX2BE44_9GAMM|nr:sigma-54 dependent transcriptional regulator [Halomonas venusta]AZM97574.1 sigma-54-dependent Fis family transcriptional regulator [Halomonas venusta]NPT31006.1 DNA-binding response regulator [Halomonas venusta]